MSIERIVSVFGGLSADIDWSLQVLKITNSKKTGTQYSCRQISLEPASRLNEFVNDMVKKYTGAGKGSLSSFQKVMDYDGTADGLVIYKLDKNSTLISQEYQALVTAIANPDVEADATAFTSAYVIKGVTVIGEDEVPIKLISMQNPITTLKHKFLHSAGSFTEITGPILSLRSSVDVIVIDGTIYFLSLAGENLFNMSRAYKAVCHEAVGQVDQAGFVSGVESFRATAESGHNPRRFVSFSSDRVEALKNIDKRKAMAKKFDIPLDAENKFDASSEGAAEKIVKLLCNKGMVDPFNDAPVEVSGVTQWQ